MISPRAWRAWLVGVKLSKEETRYVVAHYGFDAFCHDHDTQMYFSYVAWPGE